MAISFFTSISPVSSPSAICWAVTPVLVSPFRITHWIGAAPRYAGSKEAWRLMQRYFGSSSTSFGKSCPYASTTIRSGASCRSVSRAAAASSPFRRDRGWYTGMSYSRAAAFTGVGMVWCPRPLGRSGWVRTPTTSCLLSARNRSVGTAMSGVPI